MTTLPLAKNRTLPKGITIATYKTKEGEVKKYRVKAQKREFKFDKTYETLEEATEYTNQSNKLQDYYYTTVTIDLFTNQFMEIVLKDN